MVRDWLLQACSKGKQIYKDIGPHDSVALYRLRKNKSMHRTMADPHLSFRLLFTATAALSAFTVFKSRKSGGGGVPMTSNTGGLRSDATA